MIWMYPSGYAAGRTFFCWSYRANIRYWRGPVKKYWRMRAILREIDQQRSEIITSQIK
jgi:hypothetical protein